VPNIPDYTNSLGMRDKEYDLRKPPGVTRIVFLGDSVTMYARFTDLLEERLAALFPGRFEVWNCAVGGYSIREYAVLMRTKVPRYKPDVIVLSLCLNDVFDSTRILYYGKDGRINAYKALPGIPGKFDNWLYKRSYLYRLWNAENERRRLDLPPGKRGHMPVADAALKTILAEAADMGAPVKAVVFPYLRRPPDLNPWEREQRADLLSLLSRRKVPTLDLLAAFPPEEIESYRSVPADHIHLNEKADRLVAPRILEFLREEGVVPR
jgi:lysophospholipase L1-like esterase